MRDKRAARILISRSSSNSATALIMSFLRPPSRNCRICDSKYAALCPAKRGNSRPIPRPARRDKRRKRAIRASASQPNKSIPPPRDHLRRCRPRLGGRAFAPTKKPPNRGFAIRQSTPSSRSSPGFAARRFCRRAFAFANNRNVATPKPGCRARTATPPRRRDKPDIAARKAPRPRSHRRARRRPQARRPPNTTPNRQATARRARKNENPFSSLLS